MSAQLFNIILYICIIINIFIRFSVSISVLLVMFYHRIKVRKHPTNYLLLINSYICLIGASPIVLDMYVRSIYGYFHPAVTFDEFWCRFKSYLLYINGNVYFYSFLLHSIYHFCRIVYHTRKKYQSFRLYLILSMILWISGFSQLLPSLIIGLIDYVQNLYYCQLRLTSISPSLINLSILFLVPYIFSIIVYLNTICYIRKHNQKLSRIIRRKHRRHMTIFRRLIILFTLVTLSAMQHILNPVIYVLFGYLPSWSYPFKWFLTVFPLTSIGIIQIFMSPYLRRLFFQKKKINI
ncbi:hypothetical protein I4U23_013129 [Adineta vaga]|nr:hypothetical protein I4U23_013129 [Adineta vaga]